MSTFPNQPNQETVAVLGAGESGEAAAVLALELGADVTVLDSAAETRLLPKIASLGARGIRVLAGEAAEKDERVYDRVILSPGIDPVVPLVQNFLSRGVELTGELEFAYEQCQCPIVAITGTNGKTTTTQLVEAMLNGAGKKTVAAGNIGPAFSGRVKLSSALDVITLEVSSFQLETIRTFRPQVALWLNFAPDHLDRYNSMEEYYAAKLRIFENQTAEDWAIVNLRDKLPPLKAQKLTFSAYAPGGDFELREGVITFRGEAVLPMAEVKLRGVHNAENLMAALAVGFVLGVPFAELVPPLKAYEPQAHRCESIRVHHGVEYINDSKGTNLDSVEKALFSQTQPVVLIAGGKDKGFEYDSITELVAEKCRAAVLIGEMADRIESLWGSRLPCHNVGRDLAAAVAKASEIAQAGDVVLFSPGTSSFDMFKNYADRGNQFRELVKALTTTATL